ncbi:MAG: class I SAM-dependent methyltransferase [Lachnospiraceae bacterium]|nr:class I SAM-dependent methyltransferase [Lachnospiraceae bacterium]
MIVFAEQEQYLDEAAAVAQHLHMEVTLSEEEAGQEELILRYGEKGLSLTDSLSGKNVQQLRGDFTRMLPRLRQANLEREFLVKAARIKGSHEWERRPKAVDATAGLGEDSILLAAAGFEVQLFEYDPVIAALLRDALRRAAQLPELEAIVSRMRLQEGDSIRALRQIGECAREAERPDVVVLDPMFPERQKSALVKKKFQLLHQLENPCSTEEEMLEAALTAGPRKVVIKRPIKGAYLAGRRPDYSLSGKAIRYDCFTIARG